MYIYIIFSIELFAACSYTKEYKTLYKYFIVLILIIKSKTYFFKNFFLQF